MMPEFPLMMNTTKLGSPDDTGVPQPTTDAKTVGVMQASPKKTFNMHSRIPR